MGPEFVADDHTLLHLNIVELKIPSSAFVQKYCNVGKTMPETIPQSSPFL